MSPPSHAREGGSLRVAILTSAALHALLVLLFVWAAALPVTRALFRPQPPKEPQEIVALSTAVTVEKRAVPVPPRRAPQANVRPRTVAPAAAAAPRHELARTVPHAAPQAPTHPPRVRRAVATIAPSPATRRASAAPRSRTPAARSAMAGEPAAGAEPARVAPHRAPAAPKRYALQMDGAQGTLRDGQGYYYPLHGGWREDGYDYYEVEYEFQYPDGTLEMGEVPWPIRFRPSADPFAHPELAQLQHAALPGPLPGYVLPPDVRLGKALRIYFPQAARGAPANG